MYESLQVAANVYINYSFLRLHPCISRGHIGIVHWSMRAKFEVRSFSPLAYWHLMHKFYGVT